MSDEDVAMCATPGNLMGRSTDAQLTDKDAPLFSAVMHPRLAKEAGRRRSCKEHRAKGRTCCLRS